MLAYHARKIIQIIIIACLIVLTSYMLYYHITEYPKKLVHLSDKVNWPQLSCSTRFVDQRKKTIIFVGGMPRSGVTLMRAILDSHPLIQCGPESRIVSKFAWIINKFVTKYNRARLHLNGIGADMLVNAAAQYLLKLFGREGTERVLCITDPYLMKHATALKQIFPNSKFIFMVRDGRAVVHSIITNKIPTICEEDFNVTKCLSSWNYDVEQMNDECNLLGESCYHMYYELLITFPKLRLRNLFKFLNIPWNSLVLSHDQQIKNGNVKLRSTSFNKRVFEPISSDSLYDWIDYVPRKVYPATFSMNRILGYEHKNVVNYQNPDVIALHYKDYVDDDRSNWLNDMRIIEKKIQSLHGELELED